MKFSDVLNKVTGVSSPVFGVSWNPGELERDVARRIIIFLEPRRILYAPIGVEALCSSIDSVSKIKDYLTSEIQRMNDDMELGAYTRAMRKATNTFLSTFPEMKEDKCAYCREGSKENKIFRRSIDELRGTFGIFIGQLAKAYGLDVEDDLARIIPE